MQIIKAQNVGIGNTDPKAKLDVSGDLILKSATLTLADGNTVDLDVNTNKYNHYKLTGPTANFQISGIMAAEQDRIVTLYNRTGHSLEIYNDYATADPEKRILTGTGGTFAVYPGGSVSLKYDNTINKWEIITSHYNSLDNFGSGNWSLSGDDIFNANVGNVGIKTMAPMTSLQVNGNLSLVSDTILGPCSSIIPPINNNNVLIDNTTKKRSVFHILKDISCSVSLPPYLLGLIGGTDGQIVTIFMHMNNSQVKHLAGLTAIPSSADSINMIELYEANSNGNVNQHAQLTFNTGGAITLIYDGARHRWKPINYYGEIKSETYGWLKGGGPNSLINPNGGNCKVGIGLFTPSARLEAANTTNNEVAIKGWSTGVGGTAAHFSSTNGHALIVDQGNVGIGNASPAEKLDVTGHINITGSIKPNGNNGMNGDVLTNLGNGTMNWLPPNGGWTISGNDVKNSNTGNVGIGAFPASGIKFDVTGNGSFYNNTVIENLTYNNSVLSLYGKLPFPSTAYRFLKFDGQTMQSVGASNIANSPTAQDIYLNPLGGRIGINTTTNITSPLSFPNVTGKKISLYSGGNNNEFGFGIQSGEMQIYTAGQDKISFGWGSSNNFIRTMSFFPGSSSLQLYNSSGISTISLNADYIDGDGRIITQELQINGGSDLSENFDIVHEEINVVEDGMLVSIDPQNEGKLTITQCENDMKVVGVISGANGIKTGMLMGQAGSEADGEYPVALVGRVFVLATDEEGEILPGDFLTSSNKKGYAKKVKNLTKSGSNYR
ncbi:MAG: hypothetical protein IPO92_17105 [Saprospiraceae bacterium]|nr:hypothetical protein [Saprospiraceae bacterium]